jgi:hypothetical protein
MEQRWNDTDRGKPKNSEKTCPSATSPTTNTTGLSWARTQAAAVRILPLKRKDDDYEQSNRGYFEDIIASFGLND